MMATNQTISEQNKITIASRAYRNAAFSVTGGGGEEKLILDAESYDLGSNWDTTNGRFTAPVTGYYQVNLKIHFQNVDAGGVYIALIYVNGALYSYAQQYAHASTDDPSAHVSDLVPATAGQFIEAYVDCTTTESIAVGQPYYTYMSVHLVGRS